MHKLTSLPTDTLLHLFNSNFSLQKLFQLRRLNRRIQFIIESRHCMGTRKSLKIFWCFYDVEQYTRKLYKHKLDTDPSLRLKNRLDDDLIVNRFKFCQSTCDRLVQLFPKVVHLMVFFTSWIPFLGDPVALNHYPVFPYLMSTWPRLVRLSLLGESDPFSYSDHKKIVQLMCTQIDNKLHNLKHLDFCVELLLLCSETKINGQTIPIGLDRALSKLERLTLIDRKLDFSYQFLGKLGSACIGLHFDFDIMFNNEQVLTGQNHLRKITHLALEITIPQLDHIVGHFTELRSLYCTIPTIFTQSQSSFTSVLPSLAKLRHLTKLRLEGFKLDSLPRTPFDSLPTLGTVTHLTYSDNYAQIESITCKVFFRAMQHIFPSVCTFALKLNRPLLGQQISTRKHLTPFGGLTHFAMYVYPQNHDVYHHLLSEKHRVRFQVYGGKLKRAKRFKLKMVGEQIWTRRTVLGVDGRNGKHVWVKGDAVVM